MANTDITAFFVMTAVLVILSLIMPFINGMFVNDANLNNPTSLVNENDTELDFSSFASSMARAFFWYYGEIGLWGNGFKIILNFSWLYLFIRLIRGGG